MKSRRTIHHALMFAHGRAELSSLIRILVGVVEAQVFLFLSRIHLRLWGLFGNVLMAVFLDVVLFFHIVFVYLSLDWAVVACTSPLVAVATSS